MIIGFAIGQANPTLCTSDQLLADAFSDLGACVRLLRWNAGPTEQFVRCDAVLLRATWDYQHDPIAFNSWIGDLDEAGCRLFNSPSLAVWNNDKRHLISLGSCGARIARTVEVSLGTDLGLLFCQLGTDIVLKPAWGNGGIGVKRANAGNIGSVIAQFTLRHPAAH